jgi:hypothetical protein
MKASIIYFLLIQLFSLSAFSQNVEYIDSRWYKTQVEAEEIAARDEVNVTEVYSEQDYPDLYKRVKIALDDVYLEAEKNLKPYYSNMPEKPIFIMTDIDAMLPLRISGSNRTTNILYINKSTASGNSLKGILAHEMSHYILDHGKKNKIDEIEAVKHISVSPVSDSVVCSAVRGYGIEIQSEVKELIDSMLAATALVEEDTKGVPFDIQADSPWLERLMTRSIFGKYSEKESCKIAGDLRDTIAVDIYGKYCSNKGIQECRIPVAVKRELSKKIDEFKVKARSCLENENDYFYSKVKEIFGEEGYQFMRDAYDHNDYSEYPNPKLAASSIKLLLSQSNPIDKIIAINEFGVSYLENKFMELGINKGNLRLTTSEDEADMLAQIILNGESDGTNSFAVSRLKYMTEVETKYCQDKVSNGGVPSYGFLTGIHHSQCWRYWRSVKLKKELKNPSKMDLLVKALLNNNLKRAKEDTSNLH